ncbi:hypothetical protein SEA_JACKO_13 [Microbacterium phage Jacko]|nr:hypothetical protein SEA_JACKO_13 [Microbacterium phage Jacko]
MGMGAMDLRILAHVSGVEDARKAVEEARKALETALRALDDITVEMDVE